MMVVARFISKELSCLLLRLIWTAAWILWKLLCGAGVQVFLLARGTLQRELVEGGTDNRACASLAEAKVTSVTSEAASPNEEEIAAGAGNAQADSSAPDLAGDVGSNSMDPLPAHEDLVLRCLRLPAADPSTEAPGNACRLLKDAVEQVRAVGHPMVRFSVQVESDRPAAVAVLGATTSVREACKALSSHVDFDFSEERETGSLFLVHFTMRSSWDLPQDDELVDASIATDWIDLGSAGSTPEDGSDKTEDTQDKAVALPRSPQAVLRQRLEQVSLERPDVHVFMDDNPFATSEGTAVRVDFVGVLPDAWDAAARIVLACEARGVYLSRSFEVLFFCPDDLHERIEGQVESALSHCKGPPERIFRGSAVGLTHCDVSGFEDLADNVSAVLSGHAAPGWHRMEWTPHGAGAVPHHTY